MSLNTVRVFVISKLPWIKRHQRKLRDQERETPRDFIDRESHFVWGRRYLLKMVEVDRAPSVELSHSTMVLSVRPDTRRLRREQIVEEWLRANAPSRAAAGEEMGTSHWGGGQEHLHPSDENEVGKLQPPRRLDPSEYRSCEKAVRMPGIHRRA
jgi:hypothetical protein